MTSPLAEGISGARLTLKPYHQIKAESNSTKTNTLLQLKLYKVTNPLHPDTKPINLTPSQIGEMIFDTLKIPPASCLELDLTTGRYDTRELLVKAGTDLTEVLTPSTPFLFREHNIFVSVISNQATCVTFRGVPMGVPDEEIVHL